ncbi:unnamed protein product, partial [Laminaria digitata]
WGNCSLSQSLVFCPNVNELPSRYPTTPRKRTVHRRLKLRDPFPTSAHEYTKPVEQLLQQRRADLNTAWEEIEDGWTANSERMATFGLTPRTDDQGVAKLNVGGSNVTMCWHLLAESEGFKDSVLGALLEGVWGEGRIPRDADGRIVLDESPTCIKHIIHKILTGRASSRAAGAPESAAGSAVAVDEVPCLMYTAHVMGLQGSTPTHPSYAKMKGGSTILESFEVVPFCGTIRQWLGVATEPMTLIYRATRDGFGCKHFKTRCSKDSPKRSPLSR